MPEDDASFLGGGASFFLALVLFFLGGVGWAGVYIRCWGNGGLWFRPYGGSLLERAPKVTKNALPHHWVPRLGSACPNEGIAPWARREGPSMAQRGYPGIHAGMPTAQCLRSAGVVLRGALDHKPDQEPDQEPDQDQELGGLGAGLGFVGNCVLNRS